MNDFFAKTVLVTGISAAMVLVAGCNDDDNNTSDSLSTFAPTSLTIAHINDHHSHLESEGEQSFFLDGVAYRAERGGFARLKTAFDDFESTYSDKNFLKLHAGDAITGTRYFSFYKGAADADMMNTICFDAFALGNHEFDESDEGLKRFLDRLHGTEGNPDGCKTPVLSANVKPAVGTPLAMSQADDYIQPYTIKTTKEGVQVGIIGIDIKGKTQNSSRPLSTTEFLDETTTAQNYINELKNKGIEHIVLLTHYTYENDKKLATTLSGVDVIIGGDSHTLLGDFTRYGKTADDTFGTQGSYPTVLKNKDGKTVCVGQAWEYTKAIGLMDIGFDKHGDVTNCSGSAVIPVSQKFETYDETTAAFHALSDEENQLVLQKLLAGKSDLLSKDLIIPYMEDPKSAAVLRSYTDLLDDNLSKNLGRAAESLCMVRVPGTTRAQDIAGCENTASSARGSDIAQIVASAFLDGALRADFALQNAGGVRTTIEAGDISYNDAYTLLPFGNTLVNLDISGKQVIDTLEDAIANHKDNEGSSGSHPYAAGLRWDLDMTQAKGRRVKAVEVRERTTGIWSPIDLNQVYTMVTNDYIAEGRDGYTTLGPIFANKTKVEDTKLLYTQSFIDYVEKVGVIERPERSEYSHKTVITTEGNLLDP